MKSRFVWLFKPLRDSSANPRWALLHRGENDISLHLSETFIDWSMFINCKIVERSIGSNPLERKEKNLSFWIQSTFPSYQIITCPVCLDTLCNWTTKTSYRFQTSRDWYHFSTFCTDKCLDLIWICNLYIVCNNFSYQITSLLCLDGLCKWSSKTSYRFQTSKDWYYFSPFQKSWICNLSLVVSSFIRPTARPNNFINYLLSVLLSFNNTLLALSNILFLLFSFFFPFLLLSIRVMQ